jgi:predicted nuclease of predicted toxin-antitoxin system
VRFLIDENLSPKLVVALQSAYPGSTHVEALGLRGRLDSEVRTAAREGGFAILTKDDDFAGMSVLFGAPPKVVHLRAGNIDTSAVVALVLEHATQIAAFETEPETSLLVLP